MTYAANLDAFARTPITFVVLTLDYCGRTFGVAPCTGTGEPCRNTWFSPCKDPSNFLLATKDYCFSSADAPVPWPGYRPYILSCDYLPTEIKDAVTVGGRVRIELQDDFDSDVGLDPYLSQRGATATTATYLTDESGNLLTDESGNYLIDESIVVAGGRKGTGRYFRKLVARNPNYEGRPIKIYDGFLGDVPGDPVLRFSGVIDSISFSQGGTVIIEAIDLLQALNETDVPAWNDLKLVADMDNVLQAITVDQTGVIHTWDYVKVDQEIMRVANAVADPILSGCVRGQYGTEIVDHFAGAPVQLCRLFEPANPFDMLVELLEVDGGYTAAEVDEAAFAYWRDLDTNMLSINALITEPTKLWDLIKEICQLFDLRIWQAESQKITCMRMVATNPGLSSYDLTDAANIVFGSGSVEVTPKAYPAMLSSDSQRVAATNANSTSRVSRVMLYWDQIPGELASLNGSYKRKSSYINSASESANGYGSIAPITIRTRWINSAVWPDVAVLEAAITDMLTNYTLLRRNPQPLLTLDVELKDADILVGSFVRVSTDELLYTDGSEFDEAEFVVVRREPKGSTLTLTLLKLSGNAIYYPATPSLFLDGSWILDGSKLLNGGIVI